MNINGRVIAMSVVGLLATACGPKAGAAKITNAGAGGGVVRAAATAYWWSIYQLRAPAELRR